MNRARHVRLLALPVVACALAAAALAADWWSAMPEGKTAHYVGRQTCVQCHAAEANAWTGSDHDLAMDHATAETVLGDFHDQTFVHHGVSSRMYREDDRFFVETDGPDGEVRPYEVKYTFGVRPLQQYLVEMDDGRVQTLPICWDTEQERWFHIYGDEAIPHDDVLHWTKPAQNWNYMCAECHSTDLQKNYDLPTDEYHTEFNEIDVSCEACHGPGSLHVELAEGNSLFWDRRYGKGLTASTNGSSKDEIDTCARCHSRRRVVHPGFDAGDEFLDHYRPETLEGELYYCDGQILEEDYVYGSFLQSRMHREGVRCTDCHDPHTTRLRYEDNRLCTRCHTSGKYDAPSHHRHAVGSTGSKCVECHMPSTTYMVVDPRRDHSLRIPRPDLSVELGVPNACNQCHQDKTAEWARDAVEEWYPDSKRRGPHYAHAIAAGRAGLPEGEASLIELATKPKRPSLLAAIELDPGPMVRSSAVSLLGRYHSVAAREAIERALEDPEPLVRAAAAEQLAAASPDELVRLLVPRLEDPVRLVRVEAARALSVVPRDRLTVEQRAAFDSALDEWFTGQRETADQPGAHLNMGVVYANQGQTDKARAAYQQALELNPDFVPALNNLAMLEHAAGNLAEAETNFRRAIEAAPDFVEAHYNLGLLLGEDQRRLGEAADALAAAARLAPDRSRIRYNCGVALMQQRRFAEAAAELLAAHELEPHNLDYLAALVSLYVQSEQWDEALKFAERLVEIDPRQAPLLDEIRRSRESSSTVGPAPPPGGG